MRTDCEVPFTCLAGILAQLRIVNDIDFVATARDYPDVDLHRTIQ